MSGMDRATTVLNDGQEDQLKCTGYSLSPCLRIFLHCLSIVLLGIPYLVYYWKPHWEVHLFYKRVSLAKAEVVLLTDTHHMKWKVLVQRVAVDAPFPERYSLSLLRAHGEVGHNDSDRLLPANEEIRREHRFFVYLNTKYVWDNEVHTYTRLHALGHGISLSQIHKYRGYDAETQAQLQLLYGRNLIDVEIKSYPRLFFKEILNPFYIFQIASITLWSLDNYVFFAICILLVSLFSLLLSLYQTKKQALDLHNMVALNNDSKALVRRRGHSLILNGIQSDMSEDTDEDAYETVPSSSLVPGDVIVIPPNGCTLSCDAVVLSGACIVNESMLTGESVPVTKCALPRPSDDANIEHYNTETHKRHTLFAGTAVIQTRFYGLSNVLAVVVRTGFDTAKGELVRSILHPKEMGFQFYRDSMRFIAVLFCIALTGMTYCVYLYVKRGTEISKIILRCLDIITIVVPPALPAAMTAGTIYSQSRLKKRGVFCISPQRINVCGKVKLVCFDKTGTLTEEGLDLWGVVPVDQGFFQKARKDLHSLDHQLPLVQCMAACHSLTLIDDELGGDPLDVKMFESIGWTLEEPKNEDFIKFDMVMPTVVKPRLLEPQNSFPNPHRPLSYELGIIRQFTFSSAVARMSVITRRLGANAFEIYTKGAPEKLEGLCLPGTIPENYHAMLHQYTVQGYRVIALAHRSLPSDVTWVKVQKLKRGQVEKDLTFLGFLVMQNAVKMETTPVIQELRGADVKCVMVTGDNILTALSVARECKMIEAASQVLLVEATAEGLAFKKAEATDQGEPQAVDLFGHGQTNVPVAQSRYQLALTGRAWTNLKKYHPHMLSKIIVQGTIFARMSPDQKTQLVEEYQALDYITVMCGDGANDCGALKASHVGISLSEAEASVAAPFTSRIPNITCVPLVIREGRCSLVSSYGVFKYMALYSLIQFITVLTLYSKKTNLGDLQFLYIDLVITSTVAILMTKTGPYEKLVAKRPYGSLVSARNMFSIISQILVVLFVQLGAFWYLQMQTWFQPVEPPTPDSEVVVCWETTTMFLVSSFQYLILAIAFSKGRPYRQNMVTNVPFFLSVVILTACTAILVVYPGQTVAGFLELEFNPSSGPDHLRFRLSLFAIVLINVFLSFAIENVVIESRLLKRLCHVVTKKQEPKNKFKRIQREIRDEDWPRTLVVPS